MNCIKGSQALNETALLFLVNGKFRQYAVVEIHQCKCPEERLLCTAVNIIGFSMNSGLLKNSLL